MNNVVWTKKICANQITKSILFYLFVYIRFTVINLCTMGKVKPIHFFRSTVETDLLQQAILNKRRTVLKKVLLQYMGLTLSREQPEVLQVDVEYAGLGEELLAVASALMLEEGEIPEKAQVLDIEVNGVAIALDDEQQFNRYRFQTLQSPVYSLPLISDLSRYKGYCLANQVQMHSPSLAGKKIKDRESLQKTSGSFEEFYKLQAVNDFMQDLLPLVHYVPVLRLSVFDQIETSCGRKTLHTLLMEDNRHYFEILADYFIQRLNDMEEAFNLEY